MPVFCACGVLRFLNFFLIRLRTPFLFVLVLSFAELSGNGRGADGVGERLGPSLAGREGKELTLCVGCTGCTMVRGTWGVEPRRVFEIEKQIRRTVHYSIPLLCCCRTAD